MILLLHDVANLLEVDLLAVPPRAQVEMDLNKPFSPGKMIEYAGKIWIQYAYEYLPNICFRCGFIEHLARECIRYQSTEEAMQDQQFAGFPFNRLNSTMKAQRSAMVLPKTAKPSPTIDSTFYHNLPSPTPPPPPPTLFPSPPPPQKKVVTRPIPIRLSSEMTQRGLNWNPIPVVQGKKTATPADSTE